MPTCPDCQRDVEIAWLRDPVGQSDPIPIWDCRWCQRTGFVPPARVPATQR